MVHDCNVKSVREKYSVDVFLWANLDTIAAIHF